MHTLKLTQIGNSVGVMLPKDLLARLKLEKGDTVFATETPEGLALTPYDPSHAAQVELAVSSCVNSTTLSTALAK